MAYSETGMDGVITGWSEDGTDVTFPIASVPQMSAAEADADTGDARKCVYALQEKFFQWYNNLPAADKPGKLAAYRSNTVNEAANTLTRTYTFQFTMDISGIDVAAEA